MAIPWFREERMTMLRLREWRRALLRFREERMTMLRLREWRRALLRLQLRTTVRQ